jgi:hypothetical protein
MVEQMIGISEMRIGIGLQFLIQIKGLRDLDAMTLDWHPLPVEREAI